MSELKDYSIWDVEAIDDELFKKESAPGKWVPESRVYLKSEVDKVIAELEENHKKEVDRLLMKIAGLEKLVETADKLLKPKGGFTIKDVKFGGVKLEGTKETDK